LISPRCPSERTQVSRTLLMAAAEGGHTDLVEALVEREASLTATDDVSGMREVWRQLGCVGR